MEMSYFRALIFCTQTSVNPLRQTTLPLRGTAVNKQWIFKKPILSKLKLWASAHFISHRFPVEYRGGQTSWEDIFEHSMYWDLKAEGWCVIFMRQLKGLHLNILRRAECRHSVAELRQLKVKLGLNFESDHLTSYIFLHLLHFPHLLHHPSWSHDPFRSPTKLI